MQHDSRHVGEGLGVVDQGRVGREWRGEEPLFVGRVVRLARQRLVPLDHLEQRLLLAEEVLLGARDHLDLPPGEDSRLGHFRDRRGEPRALHCRGCLDAEIETARSDHMAADEQAFEHRIGVVSQQPPILERPRLALGRVDHDVPDFAGVVEDGRPLGAGREPGPAAAAQPRLLDLLEHFHRRTPPRCFDGAPADGLEIVAVGRIRRVRNQPVCSHRNDPPVRIQSCPIE